MGPLTETGILNHQGGLLMAFIIGILFGFVLEQAGFSSSRKLAGVFYGYDFVVLRVFFTAAVTAMIGLFLFGYFGIIDLNLIWVNQLFTAPAIVGGIIMGLGFIIGGFCPGTSVCAVAIGKIDAMVFVGGAILGVFFFAEAYPLFENFVNANPKGSLKLSDVLGISDGFLIFAVTVIAIVAFIVTDKIQGKVKKVEY
jgi:uncharacterized membrane protein YedE/YeeE